MAIQIRRDTAANWTSANPVLASGQPGYETDLKGLKFGDGTTAWASLAYFATAAVIADGDKGDIVVSSTGTVWVLDAAIKAALRDRATHTGTIASTDISNFAEAVDDRVAALLVEGTNITLTYNDATGELTIDAAGGGGAGLVDGDYGDVTVSGTGTIITIDNGVVTLAKMANMATASLLGRSTAGTGAPEVLSAATVRTLLNVANGATANSSDATLLDRANHTGTQTASTISNFAATVIATVLTGFAAAGTRTAVAATDSILAAFGKVQKYLNDLAAIAFSGSGADLTDASVTLAKLANMATASVFYRKTAGTGVPEVQTLATLKTDLGLTGTNSGDQTSIVGITGNKAQFNTALTGDDFLFVGDAPTAHTHVAANITDFDTAVAANSAVAANTAKVTNATHTGDATGDTALTLAPAAISGKTLVTAVGADHVLIFDATDSLLKKALVSDFTGGGGGSATDPLIGWFV